MYVMSHDNSSRRFLLYENQCTPTKHDYGTNIFCMFIGIFAVSNVKMCTIDLTSNRGVYIQTLGEL